MHDRTTPDQRRCAADERCRDYDRTTNTAPLLDGRGKLCEACLDHTARAVTALPLDYDDLDRAAYDEPTLSQALDTQSAFAAHGGPPLPIREHAEALMREIAHVTTTWETEIRARARLSEPRPERGGRAVAQAVAILAPRVELLADIAPTAVYPTGCDDPPTEVTGVEALLHMADLHQRAQSALGLTKPTWRLPGICPDCKVDGKLRREVHGKHSDTVWCTGCGEKRPYDDYERYVRGLVWPHRSAA